MQNKKTLMTVTVLILAAIIALIIYTILGGFSMTTINLPAPQLNNSFSLDQAILERRSVREFQHQDLTTEQISQLLWAGDGITDKKNNFRSAPSASGIFPMALYVVKKDGLWLYDPSKHALKLVNKNDLQKNLAIASLGQSSVNDASINVVIVANFNGITKKYGDRGVRYCYLEAGHIAQNLALEAVALGLASVPVGAFTDNDVKKVLELDETQQPIYIIPIGYKVK